MLRRARSTDVETGLYHFSPADLRMAGLRRGDWRGYIAGAAAKRPSILHARAVIAMSAIYWRSEWKYRARAYRYCYWDAGTILANLLAAAAAEEISAEVITAFDDPALETLLGIDGEREGMIALVALGRTERSGRAIARGRAVDAGDDSAFVERGRVSRPGQDASRVAAGDRR